MNTLITAFAFALLKVLAVTSVFPTSIVICVSRYCFYKENICVVNCKPQLLCKCRTICCKFNKGTYCKCRAPLVKTIVICSISSASYIVLGPLLQFLGLMYALTSSLINSTLFGINQYALGYLFFRWNIPVWKI